MDAQNTAGSASNPSGASLDLREITDISPPEAPANTLDPLSGAGVFLTKIVLLILSTVLLLLLGMLIYQESKFARLTNAAFSTAAMSLEGSAGAIRQRELLAPLLKSLQEARDGPARNQTRLLLEAVKTLRASEDLAVHPSFGTLADEMENVAQNYRDVPTPQKELATLFAGVEALVKETQPEAPAELLKARQDLFKTSLEAVNSAREFWARAAQMILLNLLLPVLTALLGYVFASKSANK